VGSLFVLLGIAVWVTPSFAGGDWNDAQIAWQPYEKGLAEAKEKKKPICMVFYTNWCPHCTNYSKVFHDPKVVEESKSFVMIRLDKDQNQELSGQSAPDGQYIPRTYFLSSDGKLDPSIQVARDKYKYFYNENEPASILAGMESAKKKLN
jgi:hypothetical protein